MCIVKNNTVQKILLAYPESAVSEQQGCELVTDRKARGDMEVMGGVGAFFFGCVNLLVIIWYSGIKIA